MWLEERVPVREVVESEVREAGVRSCLSIINNMKFIVVELKAIWKFQVGVWGSYLKFREIPLIVS